MNKTMSVSAKREEVLGGLKPPICNDGEPNRFGRAAQWPSPIVAWGWVAVLLAAYASAFADRQILSLLVGQIKADLHVSDTQFGLLQGLSFALLYTTAGIPIGALIDRTSRRRIVACGVITWSVMTAACGIASHYWQLFAARIGVGVGEGSLSPSAFAILADLFPPKRLPLALSVYTSGAGLGSGLALIAGGTVVQFAAKKRSGRAAHPGAPENLAARLYCPRTAWPFAGGRNRFDAGAAAPGNSLSRSGVARRATLSDR